MPRVELTARAVEELRRLILTHSLPPDTVDRFRRSVEHLARFPRIGRELERDSWRGLRFVLGPWRWVVIVYRFDDGEDRVAIISVQDGRSAAAAATPRLRQNP